MKKIRLITLAILVTLCSCGREEIETSGVEIGFAARSGGFTRGTVISGVDVMADAGGFAAWAYKHTGSWGNSGPAGREAIFSNTNVTGNSSGTEWGYGDPVYWPAGKKVSFFAYAPYGAASVSTDTDSTPYITYGIPASPADQKDILIAAPMLDRTGPDPVNEMFYHALSRIDLHACRDGGNAYEAKVTRVELRGIYDGGIASLNQQTRPFVWTPAGTTSDYVFSIDDGTLADRLLTTTAGSILPENGTMFLLPQALPAARASLFVEYTVDGHDYRWNGEIPTPEGWASGKTYRYTLRIEDNWVAIVCGDLQIPSPGDDWGDY